MRRNPLLGAALDAADRGWHVFPLVRAGKSPALRNWEQRATTDKRQIYRWWARRGERRGGNRQVQVGRDRPG